MDNFLDMNERTKIFLDTEFTGLQQNTSLISIGLVSEQGNAFYAEFSDYDRTQVNGWIKTNVIDNLYLNEGYERENIHTTYERGGVSGPQSLSNGICSIEMLGDRVSVKNELLIWLRQFGTVEIWSDCLSYDWVLFNSLIANYFNGYPRLPSNVYYIPLDICTLFKVANIDPDISREHFCGLSDKGKHNALRDAIVIKSCFDKLAQFFNAKDKKEAEKDVKQQARG